MHWIFDFDCVHTAPRQNFSVLCMRTSRPLPVAILINVIQDHTQSTIKFKIFRSSQGCRPDAAPPRNTKDYFLTASGLLTARVPAGGAPVPTANRQALKNGRRHVSNTRGWCGVDRKHWRSKAPHSDTMIQQRARRRAVLASRRRRRCAARWSSGVGRWAARTGRRTPARVEPRVGRAPRGAIRKGMRQDGGAHE